MLSRQFDFRVSGPIYSRHFGGYYYYYYYHYILRGYPHHRRVFQWGPPKVCHDSRLCPYMVYFDWLIIYGRHFGDSRLCPYMVYFDWLIISNQHNTKDNKTKDARTWYSHQHIYIRSQNTRRQIAATNFIV